MKFILLRSKNISATEYYYDIIRSALDRCGTVLWDSLEGEPMPDHKDAVLVVGSCMSMLRMWRKGYRNIITWFQGILPEESYMRNHSRLRAGVLSWIERFALKRSKLSIFVSRAMKEHYEQKYHLKIDTCYTMPCFNTEYQKANVDSKDYSRNVFAYAGGLSKWQCIDQTLALYKRLEQAAAGEARLLLLTPEQDKARQLVEQYSIEHVEITHVPYTKLPDVLKSVKFGFALREEHPVNLVSTPTKLANYIANGIIPIYTSAVRDFDLESRDKPYAVCIQDVNHVSDGEIETIQRLMETPIKTEDARQCFAAYFKEYYNPVWHETQLAERIKRVIT